MKFLKYLILLASICFSSGNGTFGYPEFFWMNNHYISDYPFSYPSLDNSSRYSNGIYSDRIEQKVNDVIGTINTNVVETANSSVTRNYWEYDYGLTQYEWLSLFVAGWTDNSLYPNRAAFYTTGGAQYTPLGVRSLSGYNRWFMAYYDQSLGETDPNHSTYVTVFNYGLHAMLGWKSIAYWVGNHNLDFSSCQCGPISLWTMIGDNWVHQNKTLWDAYKESIREIMYVRNGYRGMKPAFVYAYGFVDNDPEKFSAGNEKFNNVYNGLYYPISEFNRVHTYVTYE